jgi:Flp pilus assembly protein TadG
MKPHWMRLRRDDQGVALMEMALTLPILLLISVGILEFGRAFQTWQIVTNAAREGARVAVLPGIDDSMVTARVNEYIQAGVLDAGVTPTVTINRAATISYGTGTASGSQVVVSYPFKFMVLHSVAQLFSTNNSNPLGTDFTMAASATMRNEN